MSEARESRKISPSDCVHKVELLSQNILRLERQKAALGLLWQPVQDNIPLREQARMAAGKGGHFDLFVPFANGRQYGFASTEEGITSKMIPAVGLCAGPAGWSHRDNDSWLAAFGLGGEGLKEVWWVVAMRDRLVFEDQIYHREDQASGAFRKLLEAPDWEHVIAPQEWNIAGGEFVSIEQFLSPARSVKRLRSIRYGFKLVVALTALSFVLLGIYFGLVSYSEYRQKEIWTAKHVQVEPLNLSELPWTGAPDIVDFAQTCERRLDRLAFDVVGWRLQTAACQMTEQSLSITLRWQRQNGRAAWIKAAALEIANHQVNILGGGQLAEMVDRLVLPSRDEALFPTLDPSGLESHLRDRFLTLGLELKMTAKYAGPMMTRKGQPEFGHHTLHLLTSASPIELARLLSDIPALLPISLTYQPDSADWRLTVRAFHPSPFTTNTMVPTQGK